MKRRNAIIGLVVAVVVLILWKGCGEISRLKEQAGLYEASQDTLQQIRNQFNQQESRIALLVADNQRDLLRIKTNDSTILHLQEVVRDYKGRIRAATVLGTSTVDHGTSTTIVLSGDTVIQDSIVYVYPVYTTDWNDKWSKGLIRAQRDSIHREIKVRNDFEITQGWEKQGFLKQKKAVVKVVNLNPNTETREMRSFVVEQKPHRISIGLGAMYGYDIVNFKPTIVIGAGAQWSLVKL